VKTFAQLLTDLTQLSEAGAALANMMLHPVWPAMSDLLERMEQATLERLGQCEENELRRLQGERDAVKELRRWMDQLTTIAASSIAQAAEDGEVEDDEVARYALRIGEGDLRI